MNLSTEKLLLLTKQENVLSLIYDAENTSEGKYKYSLADYLDAKKVYKEAEDRLSEIHQEESTQESQGPSGPNVDKQYSWPDDVEDDCYHMEEVH
tara:strand:- start:6194 stop:6478 length:285 start_codon:yes stop_codon:yes gene_type:complete